MSTCLEELTMPFIGFPKMARLSRECVVTEKIDGTNAQVYIRELPDDEVMPTDTPIVSVVGNLLIYAGSRTRWITPENDNFGFARWVRENADDLALLGKGQHFGEWWGSGIQRGYGLRNGERRFSLFNTARWTDDVRPSCCLTVPILYEGVFCTEMCYSAIDALKQFGSYAAPGFMRPEGIVAYHAAARFGFKKTIEGDEGGKGG